MLTRRAVIEQGGCGATVQVAEPVAVLLLDGVGEGRHG